MLVRASRDFTTFRPERSYVSRCREPLQKPAKARFQQLVPHWHEGLGGSGCGFMDLCLLEHASIMHCLSKERSALHGGPEKVQPPFALRNLSARGNLQVMTVNALCCVLHRTPSPEIHRRKLPTKKKRYTGEIVLCFCGESTFRYTSNWRSHFDERNKCF